MTFKVSDVYVTVVKVIKKYITVKITHLCRKSATNSGKMTKMVVLVLRVIRTSDG